MIKNKEAFENRPEILFILECLEKALKLKDDLAVAILITRLERSGVKIVSNKKLT